MRSFERLRDALEGLPLETVYVFGSQASGGTGPRSDVDVALVPTPDVGDEERLPLRGRVAARSAAVFDTEHADVILLDEAPPRIGFQAIQGALVVDRDPEARVRLETRIMSRYHDRRYHGDRWERETLDRFKRGASA